MKYRPYIHIQRLGHSEVQGIEDGTCWIFHKLDGTNSSVWWDNGEVQAGSRSRHLSLEADNAGFLAWAQKQDQLVSFLNRNQSLRLYGEWLVPHTLKTYRQDAWRRFWIYDVAVEIDNPLDPEIKEHFLSYDEYVPLLKPFDLDYITPICTMENATEEYLTGLLDKATFLVEDGRGHGEGIVIKNYDFYNREGKQIWAKLVRQEFKEKNSVEFGTPKIGLADPVEIKIVEKFLTSSMIEKVYAKIVVEKEGWENKYIPRLLETCYFDLVSEEMWAILKEFGNVTINFGALKAYTFKKVKLVKKELF